MILKRSQWAEEECFVLDEGATCFYCYAPVTEVGVRWLGDIDGEAQAILLHPKCVVELALRLFRDVHQIECETGKDVFDRESP